MTRGSSEENPKRLSPSGAVLAVIFDSLPGMIAVASAAGELEYASRPVLDYLGAEFLELDKLGWLDSVYIDDRDAVSEEWRRCIGGTRALDIKLRLRRFDGVFRWFHARANPLLAEHGAVDRWCGLLVDIDDQAKVDEALRQSEQELRFLADGIPGLLCVCAPSGDLEYVNQPMLDLIGHPLEESKRFGWASTIHPDDRDALVKAWIAATNARKVLDYEYRRLAPDGVYRWFHVRMKPQFGDQGQVLRWFALITDIDARRIAEQALRLSELGLRRLIETIPAQMWSATGAGAPDYLNQRAVDYTGRSLSEFVQHGWENLIHPDDREESQSAWVRAVLAGGSYNVKHRLLSATGEYRWFQVRVEPLRDSDGKALHFYGLNVDIEASRKMGEALRQSQERLSRASRVAAVAELSASVAHEISQPLAAVVANGHACHRWLAADPPNLARARLILEKIIQDGNSAGEVLSRIRALFKQTAPNKIALDLNEVIAEVCQLVADDFTVSGVSLLRDLEKTLPAVMADRVQMQQLLVNLLHNGIEAMEQVVRHRRVMSICSRVLENRVLVDVRDHGSGLEDPERIFEPFFTTKEKGMGMGLAICRSIVELHGGQLWVTKNEQHGTTFSFSLPVDSSAER